MRLQKIYLPEFMVRGTDTPYLRRSLTIEMIDQISISKMISSQHEMVTIDGRIQRRFGKYCTVELWDLDLYLSKGHEELLHFPTFQVCSAETHFWRAINSMVDLTCTDKIQLDHWEGQIYVLGAHSQIWRKDTKIYCRGKFI